MFALTPVGITLGSKFRRRLVAPKEHGKMNVVHNNVDHVDQFSKLSF